MDADQITSTIICSAIAVHTKLGPGLLESVYERCLEYEIQKRGGKVQTQLALPIIYESLRFNAALRLDMLVADQIVVELKVVEAVLPVHKAQLLSYLRLSRMHLGLLLNFNVVQMRHGIHRVVHDYDPLVPFKPTTLNGA